MSISVGVQIDGTQETMKLLKKFYPDLAKQFVKDANRIAKPITDAAKSQYPDKILSGMKRNWRYGKSSRSLFPYSQAKAIKGVKVSVRRKQALVTASSVITVTQMNPAAAIIDMAGKANKSNAGLAFNSNLTEAFGNPSRVMWPSAMAHINQVSNEMAEIVHAAEVIVSNKLAQVG